MKKQIEDIAKEKAAKAKHEIIEQAKVINGVTIYSGIVPMPTELVKDMVFQLRNMAENAVVIIGSIFDDKPALTAAASDAMVKEQNVNVSKTIREAAKLIQGGGGGQPHFATAGGKNKDGLSIAIDTFIKQLGL